MKLLSWAPAGVLLVGVVLTFGVARQRALPLERPLSAVVPDTLLGYGGEDVAVSESDSAVAGFSSHLLRVYETADTAAPLAYFSIYVGYYESQTQGATIHSPKNCLPGAGWETLASEARPVEVGDRTVRVNRYLLANGADQALVLYWYQGRGRVAHDEYRVKLDLLLDAAFRRRSDEALVRIVIPWLGGSFAEDEFAARVAQQLIPMVDEALPD